VGLDVLEFFSLGGKPSTSSKTISLLAFKCCRTEHAQTAKELRGGVRGKKHVLNKYTALGGMKEVPDVF